MKKLSLILIVLITAFSAAAQIQTFSNGESLSSVRTKINSNFAYLDATKSDVFIYAAIAYVDVNGNNSTATIGRQDKPFATIDAALDATSGISSIIIQLGAGQHAKPTSSKMRSNLWLRGVGKPGFNKTVTNTSFTNYTVTNPTALVGGSIVLGGISMLDKSNVKITDLGVDCGSAFVSGGGTANNGIAITSATTTFTFPMQTDIEIRNVSTLLNSSGALFHGIVLENVYQPIISNVDTYFGVHGIAIKGYGGVVTNIRNANHDYNGIIYKSDSYAPSYKLLIDNVEVVGNNNAAGHGIHFENFTSSPGMSNIIATNIRTINCARGFRYDGSGTQGSEIWLRGAQIILSSVNGVEISNAPANVTISDVFISSAVSATSCVTFTAGNNNGLYNINDVYTLGGNKGFILSGSSGAGINVSNCAAHFANTYGFDVSGNVYMSNYTGAGNTTGLITGTPTVAFSVKPSLTVTSSSGTLNFPSTAAQSSSDLTISFSGATSGDIVLLGVPNSAVNANSDYSAWVSASGTVTVRFNNYSTGAIDPASGSFKVTVIK